MRPLATTTIWALLLAILLAPTHALAAKGKFMGNETCMDCHKAIYESWEKSKHAKVYDLLKPDVRPKEKKEAGLKPPLDYTKDKSCMECHVTGYDQGGFSFDAPKKEWEGIGCEECHGPAEKWILVHDKAGIDNLDRRLKQAGHVNPYEGKTVCLRCHGHRNSPYRFRSESVHAGRNWKDKKWAETFHILPEPKKK